MSKDYKIRNAGRSARQMAERRRSRAIIYLLLTMGAFVALIMFLFNSKTLGLIGFGFLGLFLLRILMDVFESRTDHQLKAMERADRGALAEERIEDALNELGEGFYALHDIPSPYGNIDHIILSKQSGVFLLETKSHRGRVQILDSSLLVNGKPPEKDFIAQALGNTYWLKEKLVKITGLDVWIMPILVFTDAFVTPPNKRIKNVTVTNKKYLANLESREIKHYRRSIVGFAREVERSIDSKCAKLNSHGKLCNCNILFCYITGGCSYSLIFSSTTLRYNLERWTLNLNASSRESFAPSASPRSARCAMAHRSSR